MDRSQKPQEKTTSCAGLVYPLIFVFSLCQVGFLNGICIPAYSLLTALVEGAAPFLNGATNNMLIWKDMVEKQTAEEERKKKEEEEKKKEEEEEEQKEEEEEKAGIYSFFFIHGTSGGHTVGPTFRPANL